MSALLSLLSAPIVLVGVNTTAPQISGNWLSPFFRVPPFDVQVRESLAATDTRLNMTFEVQMRIPQMETRAESGTIVADYQIGNASTTVSDAWELNLTIVNETNTPLNDATTADFNNDKKCGFDNWKTGETRDITGLDCDKDEPPFKAGDKVFSIVTIKDGKLMLGDRNKKFPACDGTTAERRFCAFNILFPMERQP